MCPRSRGSKPCALRTALPTRPFPENQEDLCRDLVLTTFTVLGQEVDSRSPSPNLRPPEDLLVKFPRKRKPKDTRPSGPCGTAENLGKPSPPVPQSSQQ